MKRGELVDFGFAVAVRSTTFERADESVYRDRKRIQLFVSGTLCGCQRFDLRSVFNEHFHALQDELADGGDLAVVLCHAGF
jgi:hypothetical protein